jgi:hypothetical protein
MGEVEPGLVSDLRLTKDDIELVEREGARRE